MKRPYFAFSLALSLALLFGVAWLPAQAQGTEGVPAASPSALHQDRLPPIPAGKLTDEQKKTSEEFVTIRKQPVFGPFVPLLRSPELMVRLASMGEYLRYRTSLPPRLSEFIILITAREWTQEYEWSAHYRIALKQGLDPEIAKAVAEGRRPKKMAEDEEIVYEFSSELHRNKSVSDATYARAVAKFGEKGMMDIVGINGYYTALAMAINVGRTPTAKDWAPMLAPLPH
ncbi:MAG: carboxymuconolactone decarboxylase family protein [Candidatus Korobacteraceae bacterium]|jgi:4-carboxymuconolactone decarboxylase